MRLMRSLPLCAMASALLCGTAAMAQQFAPRARIVERIDESRLVTLMGNTHPAANGATRVVTVDRATCATLDAQTF